MKNIIINIILIIFPILIYFIYNCYKKISNKESDYIMLSISLISSSYLLFKIGSIHNNIELLLCNIPILISYIKKKYILTIYISILTLLYIKINFNTLILINIIKYILILILYIISKLKETTETRFILSSTLTLGILSIIESLYIKTTSITSILLVILYTVILLIIISLIIYLFKISDNITKMYYNLSQIKRDEQLTNSLFKITHEIKNPISVCKGYLDMIDTTKDCELSKYIMIIKEEIDRSLNIMTNFMQFSKIKIDKEIIDMNCLIEEIEEELKIITDKKNIELTCKLIKDDIYVNGDYNRLKQVLFNMLKNSIESIDKEGKITIITHILNNKYFIEIEDTGCGMDNETLSKVKEMFYTTKKNGTGLGVNLSNEILKAHNGSLDYTSKLNKGTKVTIKLPIYQI